MQSWVTHIDEQKRGLARLLARENITVRHDNVPTAMFNVKTRELVLPRWTDITVDQYDLLIGHEVGHALYTATADPTKTMEVLEACADYHSFVNVVEDARIERRIKETYPGLRGAFSRGYADFFTKGPLFNDVANKPIDSYSLIDRINIHYKVGAHVTVPFSSAEMPYLQRIDRLRTFEEAVALAKELYELAKQTNEDQAKQQGRQQANGPNGPQGRGTGIAQSGRGPRGQGAGSQSGPRTEGPDGEGEQQQAAADDGDDTQNDGQKTEQAPAPSVKPVAETDIANEEALKTLAQRKNAEMPEVMHITYTSLSDELVDALTIDAQQFTEDTVKWFDANPTDKARAEKYLANFMSKYGPAAAHMAREFERRKSARLHERARVARTGRIDCTKLASYKFRDDLFRQVTVIPNGKSHGIILLIDGSGSMTDVMANTVDQVLLFADFARRVNIPCQAYIFKTNYRQNTALAHRREDAATNYAAAHRNVPVPCRELELVNIADTTSPYWKRQQLAIAALASYYTYGYYGKPDAMAVLNPPPHSDLGQTPIYSALLVGERLLARLKTRNRLDRTTLLLLTDGEDNTNIGVIDAAGQYLNSYAHSRGGLIIRDTQTRTTYANLVQQKYHSYGKADDFYYRNAHNAIPTALVDIIRRRHDARVVAIRLASGRDLRNAKKMVQVDHLLDGFIKSALHRQDQYGNHKAAVSHAQNKQWVGELTGKDEMGQFTATNETVYYDAAIVVNDGTMDMEADDFGSLVKDGMSAKRIAAAFTKSNITAARNKIFVNAIVPYLS